MRCCSLGIAQPSHKKHSKMSLQAMSDCLESRLLMSVDREEELQYDGACATIVCSEGEQADKTILLPSMCPSRWEKEHN